MLVKLNRFVKSGHEVEHRVTRVFSHSEYDIPTEINNDIAVLELEKPIQFNKYVQPVCLLENDPPVGTKFVSTGKISLMIMILNNSTRLP